MPAAQVQTEQGTAPSGAQGSLRAEQGTAAAVNKAQPVQGTAVTGDSSACMAGSPAACMQLQLQFKDHDLPLFSDSAKRWTTNGPSLYAFIRQVRQELCCSLEEAVLSPGYAAHQAIQAFVAAITGWLTPAEHSMTLTLLAGLCYNGDSAAAADVDN